MGQELMGQEIVGLAFETTIGTAVVPPLKWIPVRSESLQVVEDKSYRQNLRASVDRRASNQGPYHVEGDIEFEVTADVLVYFLYLARMTPSVTGTTDKTYTFAPATVARPTTAASGTTLRRTATFLVGRSARPFGYLGCSVSQLAFSYDNMTLICTASIVGMSEAQQSISAQTWPTSLPYGPVQNTVEIPSASARSDIASLSFTINDNGSAENRLNGARSAAFTRWGEREVTLSAEIDFDALTDYNAFLNQTVQNLIIKSSRSAVNDQVKFTFNNTIIDGYTVGGGGGQGDLLMATAELHATGGTTDIYAIELLTTEAIT